MPQKRENTSERKKEHLQICIKRDVSFKTKSNGFENYEFEHYALTEVEIDKIDFKTVFFGKKVNYPFIISCMTGGTEKSVSINRYLAEAAKELNIPIGVGSQRQALEDRKHLDSFKVIRKEAGNVPVLGNIGGAEIASAEKPADLIKKLIEMIEADAMVIHLNPLQELFQKDGDPSFKGLLKAIEKTCSSIEIPVIVKEVGAGISAAAAEKLIETGVKGIDVAGAGGTNWAAVEMIRNKNNDPYFREWGIPTSYCIKEINKLKKRRSFTLIASGGINTGIDAAKSLALGADYTASARIILQSAVEKKAEGVVDLVKNWFSAVSKVMYLTGAGNLREFAKVKLIKREDFF